MGWRCLKCGNTCDFFEKDVMEVRIWQEPLSTRIKKITNRYINEPAVEVWCAKCDSSDVSWTDAIGQDFDYLYDAVSISENHSVVTLGFELCSGDWGISGGECNKLLDFGLFRRIMEDASIMEKRIKNIEFLGGRGNPLLHPNIKEILEILEKQKCFVTILTNGKGFVDSIRGLNISRNAQFILFLDSPREKENDLMMGEGVFQETLDAFRYLEENRIAYSVFMRVGSRNHGMVGEMKRFLSTLGIISFTILEVAPDGKNGGLLMSSKMKEEVKDAVQKNGIATGVQFAKCTQGHKCSYLDRTRIFIDSDGDLSSCHFLAGLESAKICSADGRSLLELISINSRHRSDFLQRKDKFFPSWKPPREASSPCSYCARCFGLDEEW